MKFVKVSTEHVNELQKAIESFSAWLSLSNIYPVYVELSITWHQFLLRYLCILVVICSKLTSLCRSSVTSNNLVPTYPVVLVYMASITWSMWREVVLVSRRLVKMVAGMCRVGRCNGYSFQPVRSQTRSNAHCGDFSYIFY